MMDQFVTVVPWLIVLLMLGGGLAIVWRLIGSLDQALARLSPQATAVTTGHSAAPAVVAPAAPAAVPVQSPAGTPLLPASPAAISHPTAAPSPAAVPSIGHLVMAALEALAAATASRAPSAGPVAHVTPVPVKPPVAIAPPASGPFASAPPWFQIALHEIGFKEIGDNQGIERYISLAHAGSLGDPWCAIFANFCLESSGVHGSRSASSQSFRTDPNFVQLSAPVLGCIAVFWRTSHSSGLGHVGFYRGEDANNVWTLGGNESDMVQIEAMPKNASAFGLVGYWWPKSVPIPSGGPVMMPAGSATHVTVPPTGGAVVTQPAAPVTGGDQPKTGITATMFGGQQSAYGGPIHDDQPGVALPFHFTGKRPRVRVTRSDIGKFVDCDIVDVGPWNTHDPYWEVPGKRPQAESGIDMTGRHTNGAGIDLTAAAAQAISLDGKGRVDWRFITDTNSPDVKVT